MHLWSLSLIIWAITSHETIQILAQATAGPTDTNQPDDRHEPVPGTSLSLVFDTTTPFDPERILGQNNIINCLESFSEKLGQEYHGHELDDQIDTLEVDDYRVNRSLQITTTLVSYQLARQEGRSLRYRDAIAVTGTATQYVWEYNIRTSLVWYVQDDQDRTIACGLCIGNPYNGHIANNSRNGVSTRKVSGEPRAPLPTQTIETFRRRRAPVFPPACAPITTSEQWMVS